MKRLLMSGVALLVLPVAAQANCPGITVADMKGVAAGAFPQQYELAEFQAAAGCTMEFSGNPDSAKLNAMIRGNSDLPAGPVIAVRPAEREGTGHTAPQIPILS